MKPSAPHALHSRSISPPFFAKLFQQVELFDQAYEASFARLRGNKTLDALFYLASTLGEHGLFWHGLALSRWMRGDRRAAVRASCALIVQSALVDGVIKGLVGRQRPALAISHPYPLRRPRSTSFPSGHTSAAVFMSIVLGQADPWRPFYVAAAIVISTSRIHVGVHHASDVAGGALFGAALGALAVSVWPLSE